MGYLKTGLGFGLGYVLGARAGRQRYDDLIADARRLSAHPKVQEAAEKLPPAVQQGLNRITSQPTQVPGLAETGVADPAPPPSAPTGLLGPDADTVDVVVVEVDLESAPVESMDSQPPIDPLLVREHGDLPRSSPHDLQ